MLLHCWNENVARWPDEVAFWHPAIPEGMTFGQIDRRSREISFSGPYGVAVGESPDFFATLIAAWRLSKPALLVENQKSRVRPFLKEIPPGTVLIKQTCGASGLERSLFFNELQVFAEGARNVEGLGLFRERRGVAAISLAHSYGFGCLALPLILNGIPVDISGGPLPIFMHAALGRWKNRSVFLPAVPAIWKTWAQTGVTDHPEIGLALCAGSPLSLELESLIRSRSGLKVHNFYGTSETGAIAYDASDAPRLCENFVGHALLGTEVTVDGEGRITVVSESRATGADLLAWEDEFSQSSYHTLDLGEVSPDGILLKSCIGNAINVAGRKVSPERLERVLIQLEGVNSAVVERGKSLDFERYEEIRVKLGVRPGYDKRTLREQLRQKVESWEMPRHWEFEVG